jgi:hypothetical protein
MVTILIGAVILFVVYEVGVTAHYWLTTLSTENSDDL